MGLFIDFILEIATPAVEALLIFLAVLFGTGFILSEYAPQLSGWYGAIMGALGPYLFLPLLVVSFWQLWLLYVRSSFIARQKYVLLELRLPRETIKSPAAMELALTNFFQTGGEATPLKRYLQGQTRAWFSLEIVSLEGRVHFYIWTREGLRNLIEAGLYSQYPGLEIFEVSDYTAGLVFDRHKLSLWGCHFKKTKDVTIVNPKTKEEKKVFVDAYPIKTYIDYGLDKDPDEELKIEPMSPLLELLGQMGQGEQFWIQILIRAHSVKKGRGLDREGSAGIYDYKKVGTEEIRRIAEKNDPETGKPIFRFMSETEQQAIKSIDRNISKLAFDTGIRVLYLAKTEKFRGNYIAAVLGTFRQYNSNTQNSLAPFGGLTPFDYPWQDYRDIRQNRIRKKLIKAYRRRSYFYPPYEEEASVMSTEEVATIYHLPGSAAPSPALDRVPSQKVTAPTNLPV